MSDIIQPMRHLNFGVPFTSVVGNPAFANAGTLGATFNWPEDGVLDWMHVEYSVGIAFSSQYGIGDVAGAFIVEGVNAGKFALGTTSFSPGVLWARSDNFLGSSAAATNASAAAASSADIQYPGKLIRQNTAISLYLVVPSIATTQAQYGVQVNFNYWSLEAWRAQRKNNSFVDSIK